MKPKIKEVKLADLVFDDKNVNTHSAFGMGLLENSLKFNGFGRSGLLSKGLKIIAGNGLTEVAGSIGSEKAFVVEIDGKTPVYLQRIDIEDGSKEFYNMAMADNVVAKKNIVFDVEAVEALVQEVPAVQFWADIINEEPKKKGPGDEQRADLVEVKLRFSSGQHSVFKKAVKLGKQKFNIEEGESDSEQANILTAILQEFINQSK